MASPREIIDDIRKNYGVGFQGDSYQTNVVESLQKLSNRALKQLSEDLYSKESHFILELIQNADDNEYEEFQIPRLKFYIDNEKILVQNNEKGFTEENVRAICNIGEPTKSKILGYIGEKGIGFKSVFLVTDVPKIFSNKFHFQFKRESKDDRLGFVVPYWVEELPNFIDQDLTNIVLPYEKPTNEVMELVQIDPTLILFLQKLKHIEIENKIKDETFTIKKSKKNGFTELEHSNGVEYWKLVKKTIQVDPTIKEEKREGVKETKLILAFPLKSDRSPLTTVEQNIFAYLPTTSVGFKFIIQADFLVTSNREDIHKDRPWNIWIRDNFTSVFLDAVKEFKKDKKLRNTFYNFIPLQKDISEPFFTPLSDSIQNSLKDSPCILTEARNWLKPSEVLRAEEEVKSLVSNEDLYEFLSVEYIHSEVEIPRNIRSALGIQEFKLEHLLQILLKEEWLDQQTDEWFSLLYAYLSKNSGDDHVEHFRNLKIIKLKDNQLTSMTEGNVFFPLSKKNEYLFETEMRILKSSIVKSNSEGSRTLISNFLKRIGVRSAEPYEVIECHIIPKYETDEWQKNPPSVLFSYLKYIKQNIAEYEDESLKRLKDQYKEKDDPFERLKNSLYIRVKDLKSQKDSWDHPSNIYLSTLYGNPNNLEFIFDGVDEIPFIHPEYYSVIKNETSRSYGKKKKFEEKLLENIKTWSDFFIKLGVCQSLRVKIDPRTIMKESPEYANSSISDRYISNHNKEDTIWKDCDWSETNYYSGYYICKDWICPDFKKVIQEMQNKDEFVRIDICNKLVRIFVNDWELYKKSLHCLYYYRRSNQRGWSRDETDTSFLLLLKSTDWFPTTDKRVVRPSEVFLNKSNIRNVLEETVTYSALDIENQDFIESLGINHEITVDAILRLLKRRGEQEYHEINFFVKLYSLLNDYFQDHPDKIRSFFEENKVIFLPGSSPLSYFSLNEVLWKDLRSIFGENRNYLEKTYLRLKTFFVDKLGVNLIPIPQDFAQVLEDLMKRDTLEYSDEKVIYNIYKELHKHLDPDQEDNILDEPWWNEFCTKGIFWIDKDVFWTNDGDIFVNDDEDLYSQFRDFSDVGFLKIPKNSHPRIRHFIDATNLAYLSKSINIEIAQYDSSTYEPGLTNHIRGKVPYIIQYLFHKEPKHYERLNTLGVLKQLTDLRCYSIDDLKVKITLNENTVPTTQPTYLQKGDLFIQSDHLKDTDHLAVGISKIFGEVKGFENFLVSLFDRKSKAQIKNLLKILRIPGLPDDDTEILEESLRPEEEKDLIKDKIRTEIDDFLPIIEEEIPLGENDQQDEVEPWKPEYQPEDVEIKYKESISGREDTSQFIIDDSRIKETVKENTISEEVDSESLTELDKLTQEDRINIGRFGERSVLLHLKQKLSEKYPEADLKDTDAGFVITWGSKVIVNVVWLNKLKDEGIGHDIKLIENGEELYLEVKATISHEKRWFLVSKSQWDLMKLKREKFWIYRIFGVGTEKPRIEAFQDPFGLWLRGEIVGHPVRIHI